MYKKCFALIAGAIFLASISFIYGNDGNYRGKKILYLNSYHQGYYWGDGEQRGAENVLSGTGANLKVIYLDAKNNPSAEFLRRQALKTKAYISEFKPDVLIAADDDAFVYVVEPYYRNAVLPVVFCGINWDVSVYGAPYKNTTGMIEVALVGPVYDHLRKFAKGDRVGVLGFDTPSERKNASYFDRYIKSELIQSVFVKDFASWKRQFIQLQERTDTIIFNSPEGIQGWDEKAAAEFIYQYARVPTGTTAISLLPLSLIGIIRIPEEQGEYAARAALQIIDGKSPSQIPVVSNKKGDLVLNVKLAGKLGIIFTPAMFKSAKEVIGLE